MNIVLLCGNLAKDGELRTTKDGLNVFSFTIAVSRNYKNENGESETDFINCKSFNKVAENMAKYTKKGNKILVQGKMQVSKYQDQMGETKYSTNVIVDNCTFLTKKDQPDQVVVSAPKQEETLIDPFSEDELALTDSDLPF